MKTVIFLSTVLSLTVAAPMPRRAHRGYPNGGMSQATSAGTACTGSQICPTVVRWSFPQDQRACPEADSHPAAVLVALPIQYMQPQGDHYAACNQPVSVQYPGENGVTTSVNGFVGDTCGDCPGVVVSSEQFQRLMSDNPSALDVGVLPGAQWFFGSDSNTAATSEPRSDSNTAATSEPRSDSNTAASSEPDVSGGGGGVLSSLRSPPPHRQQQHYRSPFAVPMSKKPSEAPSGQYKSKKPFEVPSGQDTSQVQTGSQVQPDEPDPSEFKEGEKKYDLLNTITDPPDPDTSIQSSSNVGTSGQDSSNAPAQSGDTDTGSSQDKADKVQPKVAEPKDNFTAGGG